MDADRLKDLLASGDTAGAIAYLAACVVSLETRVRQLEPHNDTGYLPFRWTPPDPD